MAADDDGNGVAVYAESDDSAVDGDADDDGNRDHADGWCAIGVPDDVRCMRGEVTWIMHDACVARED